MYLCTYLATYLLIYITPSIYLFLLDDFGDKFGDAFGLALVKYNKMSIINLLALAAANNLTTFTPHKLKEEIAMRKLAAFQNSIVVDDLNAVTIDNNANSNNIQNNSNI